MNPARKLSLEYREAFASFSPNARRYLLGQALLWIGANQISLLFSLYLKRLGSTEAAIGSLLATKALGSALVALPASFIAARLDLRRLLPLAALFSAAAYVAQSIGASGAVMASGVFLAGAFSAIFQVSSGPFFMRNSGERERVHLFSLNGALSMGTGVLGSLLGGSLKDLVFGLVHDEILAYRVGLLVGSAFVLASILPFSRIEEASLPRPGRSGGGREGGKIPALLWIKLVLPGFLVGLGAGLTIPYLNLYFKNEFGLGDTAIGIAVAAGQVATFLGMVAGPAVARRWGKARSIFWSQAFSIPFILVLAWLPSLPFALLAYLVRQALMNMSSPIQDNFSLELVPPELQGLLNAVKMLAWTGSWTIAARISGAIIYERGFSPSFTLTAAFYGSSTFLFWLFFLRGRSVRVGEAVSR